MTDEVAKVACRPVQVLHLVPFLTGPENVNKIEISKKAARCLVSYIYGRWAGGGCVVLCLSLKCLLVPGPH
jgi:hypothetical protein